MRNQKKIRKEGNRSELIPSFMMTNRNTLLFFILALMVACKDKQPLAVAPIIKPDFTIDGRNYSSNYLGEPDPEDQVVHQMEEGMEIMLAAALPSDVTECRWYFDGDLIAANSPRFTHVVKGPGMHRVTFCLDKLNCTSKYVYARKAEVGAIAPMMKNTPVTRGGADYSVNNVERPVRVPKEPLIPKEDIVEVVSESKPVPACPKSWKKSGEIGLSPSESMIDCADWVESGTINLRVNEPIRLQFAKVFANQAGKVKVTFSDDQGYSESDTKVLMGEGLASEINFSNLMPDCLLPGYTYTIRFVTIGGAKLANIRPCQPNVMRDKAVELDFGRDMMLFNVKFIKA